MRNDAHVNYELLNLIGYGLAKFEFAFIHEFGYKSKTAFYTYLVEIGIAETVGVVKNRQDLFDPFFENKRKGWWQKGKLSFKCQRTGHIHRCSPHSDC